tara:strand:- start:2509 stop:2739 length:231 start_codon:yes stop_codon:yes gene_type:complete
MYVVNFLNVVFNTRTRHLNAMTQKTPFTLRFRPDLLDEVRAVSVQAGVPMTEIIEQAVERFIPIAHEHIKEGAEGA